MTNNFKYSKTIRIWLLVGLLMLIGQVILGGITRLTGSGLSITRWDIITGVIKSFFQLRREGVFRFQAVAGSQAVTKDQQTQSRICSMICMKRLNAADGQNNQEDTKS